MQPSSPDADELERWFHRALELGSDDRAALLRTLDSRSPALAAELRSYLDALDGAPEFLARPASLELLDALEGEHAAADSREQRPDRSPRSGLRIDGFELLHRLGSGASGEVWEARQEQPSRRVAVKILAHHADPSAERRFATEAETLARLDHPQIAKVFGAGTDALGDGSGLPWLAMELIPEARPLTAHAADLPLRARLEVFLEVLAGVQHAHQRGVLHRDLKPANVLVAGDGGAKIIDFGIARLTEAVGDDQLATTRQGELLGSLHWMSPEHAAGDPAAIDARSDVYSLGVLLHEIVCEAPPLDLRGRTLLQALEAIRDEEPQDPCARSAAVDPDLGAVLQRALAKDPELRYPTADALAHDLRRWLRCEPVEARQPGVLHRIGLFARRRRQAFVASVFAVVLGLAAVGTIVVLWLRTEDVLASLLEARSAESQQREVAQAARAELDEVRRTLDQLLDEENPSLPSTIARTSARQVAIAKTPAGRRETVRRSVQVLERIAEDLGGDPAARRALAEAFDDLARLHGSEWMASPEDAEPNRIAHRRSHELWRGLADEFPDDRELEERTIESGTLRIQNDRKLGPEPEDAEFADAVIARARRLVATHGGDRPSQRRLAFALWARSDLHISLPDRMRGVEDAVEALEIHRALTDVEQPDVADVYEMCWSLMRVGIWEFRQLQDPDAAVKTLQEMVDRRVWLLAHHRDPASIALEAMSASSHLWMALGVAGRHDEIAPAVAKVLTAFDEQLRGAGLPRALVGALFMLRSARGVLHGRDDREPLREAARELLQRIEPGDAERMFDPLYAAQEIGHLDLASEPAARPILEVALRELESRLPDGDVDPLDLKRLRAALATEPEPRDR